MLIMLLILIRTGKEWDFTTEICIWEYFTFITYSKNQNNFS